MQRLALYLLIKHASKSVISETYIKTALKLKEIISCFAPASALSRLYLTEVLVADTKLPK